MLISTEILSKMKHEEVIHLHNLLHDAHHLEDASLQLHLSLHQEIAKRGLLVTQDDQDHHVAKLACSAGLDVESVTSMGLPSVSYVEKEVTLCPIQKAETDKEERMVYGIALEPNEVDTYKHTVTKEEIRQAAHKYLSYNQIRMVGHERVSNSKITLLESYIAPIDLTINGQTIKEGSWVVAMKIHDDEIWAQVKSGKLTGYSIGGWAALEKLGGDK